MILQISDSLDLKPLKERAQGSKSQQKILPLSPFFTHFLPAQFYKQRMQTHPKLPIPNLPSGRAA